MFYEVQPYNKIKLEDVSSYLIMPDSKDDYMGRKMYIYLKGSQHARDFIFSTREECRRAYESLDKALAALDSPYHIKTIMD